MSRNTSLFIMLCLACIFRCCISAAANPKNSDSQLTPPPAIGREFRAVWVATVANIDWPTNKGLPVSIQKQQLLSIVNKAASLKLNTIIFQVRPACDALYKSSIEPWSEFITGVQGRAPVPAYDPLAFLIHAAHLKGIQVQAWFNPFRARFALSKSPLANNQVIRVHPHWIVHYGDQTWLNPGLPQVQRYVTQVILDVVHRYNIDGVHLDDYFYPYPERSVAGGYIPFNDAQTYRAYKSRGGTLALDSWRRRNIDDFVRNLYAAVKSVKPWVLVGISPFGIWQPSHPPTIEGYNSYAMIYSDSRLWLRSGWCDYLAPQLYWKIEPQAQSFPVLLTWWQRQNYRHRHIWPGLYADRVDKSFGAGSWPTSEITDEIKITRTVPDSDGAVMFSMVTLMHDVNSIDAALSKVYHHRVLLPASPWLGDSRPAQPTIALEQAINSSAKPATVEWTSSHSRVTVRWWVLQVRTVDGWHSYILPADCRSKELPSGALEASILAVSPSEIESEYSLINLRPKAVLASKKHLQPEPKQPEQYERTGASK